jgi:LPS export ABC transporter protein LptC
MRIPLHIFPFFKNRFVALFFLVVLGIQLVSCENDQAEIMRVTKVSKEPVEHIKELEILYSDSGLVRVKVNARELKKILFPEPITELPAGIHIQFYNENKNVTSELRAKYAIHYENDSKWEAQKDVVVINEKGERLNTEKLIWNEREEKLTSDERVTITTAEEIIYGDGFEANQDFSRYKIFNVKGILTVKK